MGSPSLPAMVSRHAGTSPDHPAVTDLDRQLSYAALIDEVDRLAAGLVDRGVAVSDRVALHLPNSVDFVVAALACLRIGAIFVPVAVSDPDARVGAILDDCAPSAVITGDPGVGRATESGRGPHRWIHYPDLLGSPTDPLPPVSTSDHPAYAIYTSGTTGAPKGVLIGSEAFGVAIHSTAQALGLDARTRTLCVSPFHFDGSFATLFPTLLVGGTVVIRPRESLLYPRTFFNAVLRERITYTGFAPSYLKLLLGSRQIGTLEDSTLEVVALGGEAGSLADIRTLWEVAPSLRIFNRYGPTETTIAVTHIELTPELVADGTVPVGLPHPGVSFHLVDRDGALVTAEMNVGELYVGGAQLMDGYWSAAGLTDAVLRDDILPGQTLYRTGDLFYRNRRGHYCYVDRADRVVKRLGVRISLLELADAMQRLTGVSGAACVVFDNDGDLGIAAFVVGESILSATELRAGARHLLPDTMLPDLIIPIDELPLTAAGKLDERRLLADAALGDRSAAPQGVGPPAS